MILAQVFHLNCFDLNSSVIYLRQTRQVIFQAWPSTTLNSDQYYICNTIVSNKNFTMNVQIGTSVFSTAALVAFDSVSALQLTLDCASASSCVYSEVNKYSIALFTLNFPDDDIIIQSAAGSLRNRIFDRLSCKVSASALVSLEPGQEKILASASPVNECAVRPTSENILIVAYVNNSLISLTPVNLSAPPFSLPSVLQNNFIRYVNSLPFVCATRPDQENCVSLARQMIQNEFTNFVGGSRNKVNVRYQGAVQEFDQNIKFLFTQIQSQQEQDCYSSSVLTFYEKYLRIEAYPGACAKCSLEYFGTLFSYDSVYLKIIMNTNQDYSGFSYQNEYKVKDYVLGTKFDRVLTCEMMTDVEACKTQLPLLIKHRKENSSIQLAIIFKYQNTVVYKSLYTPQITQTLIQAANVTIFDHQICVKYQPVANGYVDIQVVLHEFTFDMNILTDTKIQVYCNELTPDYLSIVQKIEKQKLSLVGQAKIGSQIINDVHVLLILKDSRPTFVWIIAATLIILSFCAILYLALRQK
ncbi:Conserved_hypothetical protein [Hexamita inflata]|uniref:Uncharacterized protein n=1 Tax=Hexamita inflata TaxID=28002 RepID=A0AA86VRT4_9EUKA|nr:Conserved hypothetical protein [Hexamita inflata]